MTLHPSRGISTLTDSLLHTPNESQRCVHVDVYSKLAVTQQTTHDLSDASMNSTGAYFHCGSRLGGISSQDLVGIGSLFRDTRLIHPLGNIQHSRD